MKRRANVEKLRSELARLTVAPGPAGQRGTAMWALAVQIAAATGEPVRAVFGRAVKDAVALEMRRAFR